MSALITIYYAATRLLLLPFSAYPFTDIRWTVGDSPVIRFEIREKRDSVAIDELDCFQIENDGLVVLFHETF